MAGTHYQELSPEQALVETESPIKVLHWFWYGCPSCMLFTQQLEGLNADDLDWQTYPVRLRTHWYFHAKAYHVAAKQENAEALNQELYRTLSQDESALSDQGAVLDWFEQQGVERELVADQMTSPLLNLKLADELALQHKWHIKGVPAVVVDERYLVDASMVNSLEEFVAVIQFLLQQARQNRVLEQAKRVSSSSEPTAQVMQSSDSIQ